LHRQHHGSGNEQILNQLQKHFKVPSSSNSLKRYKDTLFMTQVMQGICIKTEAEHYRRIKSEIDATGRGHAMGSIYWQLNDIWQGASWASIEYGGRWKVLHYLAKDFYAPVIVSSYITKGTLGVYLVNDQLTPISGNVTLRAWSYTTGLKKAWTFSASMRALTAGKVYQQDVSSLLSQSGCSATTCLLTLNLEDGSKRQIHENFLFLGDPKSSVFQNPKLTVVNSRVVREGEFEIAIQGSNVAPLVWLETTVPGRFERNAFVYTEGVYHLRFFAWEDVSIDEFLQTLTISSLFDRS